MSDDRSDKRKRAKKAKKPEPESPAEGKAASPKSDKAYSLAETVKGFPRTPGVYLMKDDKDRVLYVGKARSLRDRVRSYFQPPFAAEKTENLMAAVVNIEYLELPSEVTALLMEARLIKDLQPKFNCRVKDGKTFPFLAVSLREDFPRVKVIRGIQKKNYRYYGPFVDAKGLRAALRILQRVFRFRNCDLDLKVGDKRLKFTRPCLLYHIQQCSAPCAARIGKLDYRRDIKRFRRFLEGKRKPILREIEEEMKKEAGKLGFERAALLRDQLRALESLIDAPLGGNEFAEFQSLVAPVLDDPSGALAELGALLGLPVPPRTIEGVDIATIGGTESVGSIVTFLDGAAFKDGYRRYRIKTAPSDDDYAMISEVARRRFRRLAEEGEFYPDVFLIDGGRGHLTAVRKETNALEVEGTRLLAIAKKEELLYTEDDEVPLRLPSNSPALSLLRQVRDEAHRFARHYHHLLRGKRILK